ASHSLAHLFVIVFFFFSSRRRHTRFSRDWSSDVCSSDLILPIRMAMGALVSTNVPPSSRRLPVLVLSLLLTPTLAAGLAPSAVRSEERRVGKECRSRRAGEQ